MFDVMQTGTGPTGTGAAPPRRLYPRPRQPAADEPIGNVATRDRQRDRDPQRQDDAAQGQGRHLSQRRAADIGEFRRSASPSTTPPPSISPPTRRLPSTIMSMRTAASRTPRLFDVARGTVAFVAAAVAKTGDMKIRRRPRRSAFAAPPALSRCRKAPSAGDREQCRDQALSGRRRQSRPHRGQRSRRRAARFSDAGRQRLYDPARRGRHAFAAVPLAISPQQALRDQGFVRQVHAAQTLGRQIVTQRRIQRLQSPARNNPGANPARRPGPQKQNGLPQRPGSPQQPALPNRPGRPSQQSPDLHGQPGVPGAPRPGLQNRPGLQKVRPASPAPKGKPPKGKR